jgi:hypothetical protein
VNCFVSSVALIGGIGPTIGSPPMTLTSVRLTYITSPENANRRLRMRTLTNAAPLRSSITSPKDFSTRMVGARLNGDRPASMPDAHT